MFVAIKASFDKKRSKDVALVLAEIIKQNGSPGKLEISIKSGTLSFLYIPADGDSSNFFDVQNIIEIMAEVESFKYNVVSSKHATEELVDKSSEVSILQEDSNTGNRGDEETETVGTTAESGEDSLNKGKEGQHQKDDSVPVKYKILDLMKKYPDDSEGINASYFVEVLGIERKKIACHLTSLLRDGKIEKVSRGFYKVVREKSTASETPDEEKKEENKEPETSTKKAVNTVEKPRTQNADQAQFKRYKELSEIPFFAEIDSLIDFKLSRESNIKKVLNILYSIEEPEENVRNDLFVRISVAVTLVSNRVDFNTINANLEDYDTGVTEESRKQAEEYLIRVFNTVGYTTTYLKFLTLLNKQFMGRYKDPDWSFAMNMTSSSNKTKKRVKINDFPENEEFEIFLGSISDQKTAGSKVMEKIVDYMDPEKSINYSMREDICEVFRVSYTLKKINADYIFVNGKFTNRQHEIERATQDLVDRFVNKIAPDEKVRIRYITFLRNLNEALRKA